MEGECHNINVKQVAYDYDVNGVNSIYFLTDEGGFFPDGCGYVWIQRGSFIDLDEEPVYHKPYIEMN